MAEIAGIVFDRDSNAPIENATVTATDKYPTGRTHNYSTPTDGSGLYVIRGLPNSEFTVNAAKVPDYASNKVGNAEVDLRTRNNATDINIPLTPRRPPRSPARSEGRREEERGYGAVKGEIKQKDTEKPIFESDVFAYNPETQRDIPGEIYEENKKSMFRIENIPTTSQGILFIIVAKSPDHKQKTKNIVVKPGNNDAGTLELEPEKTKKKKLEEEEKNVRAGTAGIFKRGGGWNLLSWINLTWLNVNKIRLLIATVLTIFLGVFFYQPFFSSLGQEMPFLIQWIAIPILSWFIIFYTLQKPGKTGPKDWLNIVIAAFLAVGSWWLINNSPLSGATFIQWGVPFAVYLFSLFTSKNKGPAGTLISIAVILLIIGGITLVWNLVGSGAATDIETYLKALNVLHLIGVPQESIDNMKDGVRNVLSFLQFKGAEPVKPEAKKIGGFEAIQLKFGSRYNDFLLPTMFARMDYVLPVTVTNPNKFDTNLVVHDFKIDEIYLNNGTGTNRIICGADENASYVNVLGNIQPEEERVVTINFKGKTSKDGHPEGTGIDCRVVSGRSNPMFSAMFSVYAPEVDEFCRDKEQYSTCVRDECNVLCKRRVNQSNTDYNVSNALDEADTSFKKSTNECTCKVNRYYNIMDDLCFLSNDRTRIELRSTYSLDVQGKGELIMVKIDADRKSAPKPVITSSAGPLTVTTYFVSDIHVPGSSKTSIMFIQIANDGDGTAQINELKINDSVFIGDKIDPEEDLRDDKLVVVKQCQPSSRNISITKDGITLSCPVNVTDADKEAYESKVTGAYLTVPVIVDINYTYSQTHSTTVNVKKEVIPDGVTNAHQIRELDTQFGSLLYYCPNEKSEKYGQTPSLKIYSP